MNYNNRHRLTIFYCHDDVTKMQYGDCCPCRRHISKTEQDNPQLLWKTGVEVGTDDYVAAFIFSQAGSPGDIGYSGIKC